MSKVLVTGATGFVGKRLILTLLDQDHEVYALCRIQGTEVFAKSYPNMHYVFGDLRNPSTLTTIPHDIEAAYYLVHSMSEIVSNLSEVEKEVAQGFLEGVRKTEIKQIIYLSGIINDEKELSPHLKSRLLVEDILKNSGIPTTILRGSIIIGSGSASFEIIRDLCEKLPIMIAPKWVNSPCQPIAISDVLFYLSNVLLNEECYNNTFDIGGPEVLTFKDLLYKYSKYRHLRRRIFNVPVLTPRISSFWLVFITSVKFSICFYLVESIHTSSVVRLMGIQKILPHRCQTFDEGLEDAFQKIKQNTVISTWMDSWEMVGINPNINDYIEVPSDGCLKDVQRFKIQDSRENTIERVWSIGGEKGYSALNWTWRLRGLMDQFMGGVGLNRGRRHPSEIIVGDAIDFWRVLKADKEKGDLILFATMKVPGEAWLQFKVEPEEDHWVLIQQATFRPRGIFGRLYWYALVPFHYFIFRRMAKVIAGQILS